MEIQLGPVFAVLSAAFFAGAYVLVRRATHQSEESFSALSISLLVGTPIFALIALLSGQWQYLLLFTWQQYVLLGAAGILHFIITRYFYLTSVRIMGANPTAAIIRTSVIFAVILGVAFLGESITGWQIWGAVMIMLGAVLSSIEIGHNTFKVSVRGLMPGLGAGLGTAGSAALIRKVMLTTDALYAATFISYLAGFIIIVFILLVRRQQRHHLWQQSRYELIILSSAALLLVIGHIFRFSAFEYSPISVAQPLMGTIVIFVLLFSFFINRRIDVFNWRVILGIMLVLAGVFLVND
jgi:drug/metabolite transporter (DMT)-like permease